MEASSSVEPLPATRSAGGPLRRIAVIAPVFVPALLGFGLFSSTGRDDSYITIWAAEALVRFGQIVNYNGDRVEQSSSLLHVLMLALLSKTGLSLGALAVLVSVAFGCLAVWLTQRLAERVQPGLSVAAGWLTATALPLVYWSFGGLETTLAACGYAAVAWTYTLVLDEGWRLRAVLGAFAATVLTVMTRPEAMFVLAAVLAGLIALGGLRDRAGLDVPHVARTIMGRGLGLMMIVLTISVALLLWRHAYFGAWFPQPVIAKARGFSLAAIRGGIRYFRRDGWQRIDGSIWVIAGAALLHQAVAAFRRKPMTPAIVVAALFTGAGLSFDVANGGDWMEGGRFLVPIVPTAVVSAIALLGLWIPRRIPAVAAAMVAAQLAGTVVFARHESTGGPPWAAAHIAPDEMIGAPWFDKIAREHYREWLCSDRLIDVVARLRARIGRPVVVMTGQAGLNAARLASAAFGDFRLIDSQGLSTRDSTDCPLTAALQHSTVGVVVTSAFYFDHLDQLQRVCHFTLPDVVYGLDQPDRSRARFWESRGYAIVFRMEGQIVNGSRLFPGAPIRGGEFIAVHGDVSANLSYPPVRFIGH
jgi:hypothetical protein